MSERVTFRGILHFFSESGTEGGYWAFQDEQFITKQSTRYGVFSNQSVWDANDPTRKGIMGDDTEVLKGGEWLPLPDPVSSEPDYVRSSLFRGEASGDREADQRLMEKYGFSMKYSADRMDEDFGPGNWTLKDNHTAVAPDGTRYSYGGTPNTEPSRPYGVHEGEIVRATVTWEDGSLEHRTSDTLLVSSWSYEGLHVLRDGDLLTIYNKEDSSLIVWQGAINLIQHELFTEDALGMWIHADQKSVDRETWADWFFNKNPAELTTKARK